MNVQAFPQPRRRQSLLAAVGDVCGHALNDRPGQLGAGPAIGAGVVRTEFFAQSHQQYDDARDRGATRALFLRVQRLGQESPERQRGRVNVPFILGEVSIRVGKGLLDRFLGQHLGKCQAVLLHEGGENQAKTLWQCTAR